VHYLICGGACVPLALCGGTGYRIVSFNENTDSVQSEITGGGSILEGVRLKWRERDVFIVFGWVDGCVEGESKGKNVSAL